MPNQSASEHEFWQKLSEAIALNYSCIRAMEDAEDTQAQDYAFLCEMGIVPDLTVRSI